MDEKDALLIRARATLIGTQNALEQMLRDDDDIVLSQSVIGGFMDDTDQIGKRKPEFYQQLGSDYIAQLRKETFSKVAHLSGRGEGTVMRFFDRINWRGRGEESAENQIRQALNPPLPATSGEVDIADFFGKDAKSQEEHDARQEKALNRKIAWAEAETKITRIIFLLRDLHAQSAAEASFARMAETKKQNRFRIANFLIRPYGQEVEHV